MSSRRAPADEVFRLEVLYRETYRGWTVAHFHEWYREKHGGGQSYTWAASRRSWKSKSENTPETSAKREAAKRWVAAVNNWGQLGWWVFLVCWNPSASATS